MHDSHWTCINFLSPTPKKNWAALPLHAAVFWYFPAVPLTPGHSGTATGTSLTANFNDTVPKTPIPTRPKSRDNPNWAYLASCDLPHVPRQLAVNLTCNWRVSVDQSGQRSKGSKVAEVNRVASLPQKREKIQRNVTCAGVGDAEQLFADDFPWNLLSTCPHSPLQLEMHQSPPQTKSFHSPKLGQNYNKPG